MRCFGSGKNLAETIRPYHYDSSNPWPTCQVVCRLLAEEDSDPSFPESFAQDIYHGKLFMLVKYVPCKKSNGLEQPARSEEDPHGGKSRARTIYLATAPGGPTEHALCPRTTSIWVNPHQPARSPAALACDLAEAHL